MDPTGLTNLEFLTNDKITIVLLSDNHAAFDPYAANAIHQWVNKKITKAPTSYILAESTSFSDAAFTFHILPMYFSKENVHFCDNVRFVFRLISETTGENATKVIDFVNSLETRSNILETMDLSKYKSTEPITRCGHHKFDFLTLAKLINNAAITKNIYNRIVGDHAEINGLLLSNIINYMHENKTIKNVHQSVLKEIFAYELLLYHLMHINFMYRVINFIKLHKPGRTNEQLWQLVTSWLSASNKLVAAVNNVIGSLAHVLDYVMILKAIEIYELSNNTNVLIWINAGNGHTLPISLFLKQLFNEILPTPLISTALTPDLMRSETFTNLVKDPKYGLQEPPKINKPLVASSETVDVSQLSKETLINAVHMSLIQQYKVPTIHAYEIINILKHPSIKANNVIRIAGLIETKGILKAFELAELADAIAMSEADIRNTKLVVRSFSGAKIHFNDDSQYAYTPLYKVAFNKPFFAIHLPMFTPSEETFIYEQNATADKFIYHDKSVLFAELLPDVDVLTVSPASNYAA